jgi:hypothetical protein
MSTTITQVANTSSIRDAEFVRIDVVGGQGSPYCFSSSFQRETIADAGFVSSFTNLGGLLSISGHQRDISATSFDTTVSLAGVDKTKIGQIIDAGLKGSEVNIWRGFYTENYQLSGTPVKRYKGIVTSYDLQEDRVEDIDSFVLNIHCSNFKQVLENRVVGRFTNASSWKVSNPTDTSMDRVSTLNGAKYNFGQKLA